MTLATTSYKKYCEPELPTRSGACAYRYPLSSHWAYPLSFLAVTGIERAIGASADNFRPFSNNDSHLSQLLSTMCRGDLENDSTSDKEGGFKRIRGGKEGVRGQTNEVSNSSTDPKKKRTYGRDNLWVIDIHGTRHVW